LTSSGPLFAPGLLVGQTAVANDVAVASVPNPSFGTEIQPFPMMADISRSVPAGESALTQTNLRTWKENNTWFYSGQIFFPDSNGNGTGTLSFGEQNDDSTFLRIDGVTVLNDTVWDVTN